VGSLAVKTEFCCSLKEMRERCVTVLPISRVIPFIERDRERERGRERERERERMHENRCCDCGGSGCGKPSDPLPSPITINHFHAFSGRVIYV
jgi:hypothetical protein